MVRDRLAPIILQTVGGDALPLKYTWYMVGICHLKQRGVAEGRPSRAWPKLRLPSSDPLL